MFIFKKYFLFFFFCWIIPYLSAQTTPKKELTDTIKTKKKFNDTIKIKDTEGFETTVVYSAEDSVVSDFMEEKLYLYGKSKVLYGDVNLEADNIIIDQKKKTVMSYGSEDLKDSTGKRVIGRPVFKQKADLYESDTIKYNIQTQKAIVKGIATKQGEGYVVAERAKRNDNQEMSFGGSKYTTCNQRHPHWYISAKKIKMVPGKKVVSGPFNLVIADIPTPLGLPFGMFPFTETRKSGIIVPTYGEAVDRGFFLRQGGYYWAASKYVAIEALGEIYTNGSWGLNFNIPYKKRYFYGGNANIQYFKTFGNRDNPDYFERTDFRILWSHQPSPRGKGTFSANVNFGSQFANTRSFDPNNQIANTFNSDISYSNSFNLGVSTLTLSAAIRQNQNVRTNEMNLTAPDLNIAINRIYPFKSFKSKIIPEFIRKISINYQSTSTLKMSNRNLITNNAFPFKILNGRAAVIDTNRRETLFPDFNGANFSDIFRFGKLGITHNIPINTTIKLKNISLNPSINYQEAWYFQKLGYTWADNGLNQRGVIVDTIKGFARVINYSASASVTTRIYGIFQFGKNKRIQTIRHTIIPTAALSYQPDFSDPKHGYFTNIQIDSTGRRQFMSNFFGFEPAPSVSVRQSGVITFGLQNIFEAKIKGKSDTAQAQKVTLLDNVSINSSYNMSADSMKIAPLSISARTKLFKVVDFNFGGIVNPYQYIVLKRNEITGAVQQQMIDKLTWNNGNFGQLQNANVSLAFDLTPKSYKDKTAKKLEEEKKKLEGNKPTDAKDANKEIIKQVKQNPNDYVDFDIPWGLQVNYNASYTKIGFNNSVLSHQANFTGNISLTTTWKMNFRSGYDFTRKQMSYTSVDMVKDLHCWEMRFSWVPFGAFQSWNFTINIKSSMLQDLRLTRQRSFYDRNIAF
ncbi:MAG: LPS-assembly protein LptD [Cytophagales bacterium]|nr:MAG: LPS-assembly protein LptD [Cytophagales bacterium]